MTDSHQLLTAVAAAAGYGTAAIAALTEATLPSRPGGALSADEESALIDAIDVAAQAGMTEPDLTELVGALRRTYPARWRERFWRGQFRAAAIRAARPDRYGSNPVRHVLDRAGRAATRRPQPDRSPCHPTEVTSTMQDPSAAVCAEHLAAQIAVPIHLPRRLDGSRLDRLSASSLAKFIKCPEEWRRHYLCRERFPATPAMALGSIVDNAVGRLVSEIIAGRKPPVERTLLELVDHERASYLGRNEVAWTDDEPQQLVERIARDAVTLFSDKILPTIAEPIAVQRQFRFKLSPHAAWTIVGAIDVEEPRRVRDTKVKARSLYGHDIEGDVQASTYLLVRWLEQNPAETFIWDIILKPGKQRRSVSSTQIPTRRSVGQLRSMLIRYAAAARRMAALDAAFGPDQPWDFADPRHTLCSERYCSFFESCPGGGGLSDTIEQPVEQIPANPIVVAPPVALRQPDDDVPAPPDPHGILVDEVMLGTTYR